MADTATIHSALSVRLTRLTDVPDEPMTAAPGPTAATVRPGPSNTDLPATALPNRSAVRTAVVRAAVIDALDALAARRDVPVDTLTVLDIGGGTGGLAVHLAQRGHHVTVVDPSPDSLAALDRRAAETATLDRVRGLQGDAAGISELFDPDSMDLVLCHSVLEIVDDPVDALRAIAGIGAADGVISLLVANRVAAVVARASTGRLAEAAAMLTDPAGRAGPGDPLQRRFTVADLHQLAADAGVSIDAIHGVRTFADAVPAQLLDDSAAAGALLELERAAAADPAYIPVATQLHAIARRA